MSKDILTRICNEIQAHPDHGFTDSGFGCGECRRTYLEIFDCPCADRRNKCYIMHSRNHRYPDYQELTMTIRHEDCRKKLLAFLPPRQTFLERAALIEGLNEDSACLFCWPINEEYFNAVGCCKHCSNEYLLKKAEIILRIFLVGNMGLVEDVTRAILRLLVPTA